jgi:hypothetical protein
MILPKEMGLSQLEFDSELAITYGQRGFQDRGRSDSMANPLRCPRNRQVILLLEQGVQGLAAHWQRPDRAMSDTVRDFAVVGSDGSPPTIGRGGSFEEAAIALS